MGGTDIPCFMESLRRRVGKEKQSKPGVSSLGWFWLGLCFPGFTSVSLICRCIILKRRDFEQLFHYAQGVYGLGVQTGHSGASCPWSTRLEYPLERLTGWGLESSASSLTHVWYLGYGELKTGTADWSPRTWLLRVAWLPHSMAVTGGSWVSYMMA